MAVIPTGYGLPVSKLITLTGLATLVLAPFGAFALNFSAITAAICMGPEAHEDKARRTAAVVRRHLRADRAVQARWSPGC